MRLHAFIKGPARLFLTGELRPELSSKHEETCAGSPETRLCDDHHSSGPWPESTLNCARFTLAGRQNIKLRLGTTSLRAGHLAGSSQAAAVALNVVPRAAVSMAARVWPGI